MNADLRRIHHLTEIECRMLMLFRHLSPEAQAALANIAWLQVAEESKSSDNVVPFSSRVTG